MQEKYEIVQHPVMGRTVVAKERYAKDELVCVGKPRGPAPVRDTHSLQMSEHEHVYLDEPAQVFSHSCGPNMYIANNEFGGYSFYAARAIEPGERLAFHYGMSEAESVAVPDCHCGAPECIGKSVGFKQAPPDMQARLYSLGIANYLRTWYEAKRKADVV